MKKTAYIFGVLGQDGILLSAYLKNKGYRVYGSDHQTISESTVHNSLEHFEILDVQSKNKIEHAIQTIKPDEIYNFAGKSFIPDSWTSPSDTIQTNSTAVAFMLEAILKHSPKTKFFQASSADIFGKTPDVPQHEESPCIPQTPYAASKLMSHNLIKCFRDHHKIFACSGILYNHESEFRGDQFVTKKIAKAAAEFKTQIRANSEKLILGDITGQKDWSSAHDFIKAFHLILNQDVADDYVIGSGILHSVEDVLNITFSEVNLNWRDFVTFSDEFKRNYSTQTYLAKNSKIKSIGWKTEITFEEMLRSMVKCEINKIENSN